LVAESHSILARWRNHFSQLLNIHGFNNVRQTDIPTAEPYVSEPSDFEVQLAIEKLKSRKSPGTDHIPPELIKAERRIIRNEIHKLTISVWNKEKLPDIARIRSFYLSIRRAIKEIVIIIGVYHSYQLRTKFYPASCCQG